MSHGGVVGTQARSRRLLLQLAAFVLLMLLASLVRAEDCSQYPNGIIDGFAGTPAPSQLQIDRTCTIRNYPGGMSTNFSFLTQPGQTNDRWLVIFDNVVHTGQMACNAVAGHKIWFTNGSSTQIQEGCQNLLIPVEKINKQNPTGQTTAVVGVPFTYRLTIPILFDPGTSNTIDFDGSPNELHGITVTDDLNATGVDLTYLSHTVYWEDSGAPVPHTFSNVGGVLTFDNFPIIPAAQQFVIEITVVLDNTPTNANGTQFINTAKWDFGRLIDGVFYDPLPGEWGISPPLTIAAPELTVEKTGPATMNLGEWGQFTLDVHNAGGVPAWDTTILDQLPDGATGGMCTMTPQVLSARVFTADGVTPVPGKGVLVQGTDFSLSYAGAPNCVLTLTMLSAAAAIGPNERLLITYRTQLDTDTDNGVTLTNVAGATQWFTADDSDTNRRGYTRTLTNGTVGTLDHEDAHTVTVALFGYFYEKTVANVTSGANPAATATPGDTLRYTLRLRTTDSPLNNLTFFDDLGVLNSSAVFVPGSLTLVTVPNGASTSNTNPTGGTNGAGILDIRNLSLPADSEILVQFDIRLASSLPHGTLITNQADLLEAGVKITDSDDPNVNGPASPTLAGDEDPTRLQIVSLPAFQVLKTSTDLTGDPNVLLAGETLRYTITVKNIGTDSVTDATIRDAIPVHTSYVAGSTTLNGVVVTDVAGLSPLVNGTLINAPENTTPGALRADASSTTSNVATITFDVRVNTDVVDGTVIANQAFVSAVSRGIADDPSDDPATPILDDPTRDVVGNVALLFADKRAVLLTDGSSPGVVDPGDVLRYTITVYNTGAAVATGTMLQDAVPANTTYVANSLTLNGLPVGQPDGGVSPLVAGIDISSGDLTPPLPASGQGRISIGNSAVIQFDLRVNDGVPGGTLITNQATVRSEALPALLTDGDGNPATGPEPTVVVVGAGQQLSITKQVAVVGGGAALPGAQLEYLVRVTNIATVPAQYVVITDDLDASAPGQLTFVDQSATLNGATAGISITGSLLTADYATTYGPLQPGEVIVLRFRALINANLPMGTRITNTAHVSWNNTQTANASVSVDVGGVSGVGILSGMAWHDANFDKVLDTNERVLSGWNVTLYRNDQPVHTALTDGAGLYRISGVAPNYATSDRYELRFTAPNAGANTALLGFADSPYTNGLQRISGITVEPGSNLQNLNLPIEPNGVVYNTVTRTPIAGATLTLLRAGTALPTSCFEDAAQQGQITPADGYYRFDINFADPACPSGGDYLIDVVAPSTSYIAGYSQIIPPTSSSSTAAFSVPACLTNGSDVIAPTARCEAQTSEFAPALAVQAGSLGTQYHVHLTLDGSDIPGTSQIFNNHIPLDPDLSGSLGITKTTPLINVTRGQLVPYVITVTSSLSVPLQDVRIVDRFPAGFRYVEGSAQVDGVAFEPTVAGRELVFSGLTTNPSGQHRILLLLAVGAGVGEGEFVNRAQALHNLTGNPLSGEASATVRVTPDPTFDCTDVTGKVFDDANRNGSQEAGEKGLPGVRLVSARGLTVTTDEYGRFHLTCAITPHSDRGSNFVLKLDDRTLPSGYRSASESVKVQRATRGKALTFNFAVSLHRVVGLDLADAVFEPNSTTMRLQWRPRIELLLSELQKGPAVLRLSYLADLEDEQLVERRLSTLKETLTQAWKALDDSYALTIEPQVFWRRGAPVRVPGSR